MERVESDVAGQGRGLGTIFCSCKNEKRRISVSYERIDTKTKRYELLFSGRNLGAAQIPRPNDAKPTNQLLLWSCLPVNCVALQIGLSVWFGSRKKPEKTKKPSRDTCRWHLGFISIFGFSTSRTALNDKFAEQFGSVNRQTRP